MGMDVYGRNPTALEGEYFRATIDAWPLLVKVLTTLCPDETSHCKWEYNDGYGLNGEQALALAEALERKLQSGEVASALCDPAIVSNVESPILARLRSVLAIDIPHTEPDDIDEHFVAEFAAFVRASGGFSIW